MGTTGSSHQVRVLRGAVAATVATGVALASHVAGGAPVPGWLGVVAPWAITVWLSTLLAGRHVARWRTASSVVVGQVLFHTLFVLGTPVGAPAASDPHAGHAVLTPFTPTSATVDLLQADARMGGWHAAAAVATAALLYRGELLLHRLLRAAGTVVTRLAPPRLVVPAAAIEVPTAPALVPVRYHRPARPRPQLRPLQRRGPPALSAS
ncbi:hypothetical protein [Isoptericola sediminis]|uniref:Uncharacterized protein n=1 Tax=Isoptericola sediminis TaxID=2733572 RepID=A0A849JYR1_9MICO|nr:hypothetical protein [Isoptericola sediminis]NNU28436.1 hypothetical protein [Isoptericola sediminis]